MDMETGYDWLLPRAPFSRQAKILETQLLYSESLTEKSSAKILQRSLSSISSASPSEISKGFLPSQLLMTVRNQELTRLASPKDLVTERQARKCLIPEDRLLISKLRHDLRRKERQAFEASKDFHKERLEVARLRKKNLELGHQLEKTLSHTGSLQAQLGLKEMNLASKNKAMAQLNQFLQDTAVKQAKARDALKMNIEHLIERVETAETKTDALRSSTPSVSQTLHLQPQTGDSTSTVYGSENNRLLWSVKSHPGRGFHYDKWHVASVDTNFGTSVPDHDPQLSRVGHPSANQSLLSPVSDRAALSLEFGVSPIGLQSGSGGYSPDAVLPVGLGLGSRNGRTPLPQRSKSFLLDEEEPAFGVPRDQINHNHSVGRQIHTNHPQSSTIPPQVESMIRPSMESSLHSYPSQQRTSLHVNKAPALSDSTLDLNLLKEVVEDVLKKREMENQPALQNVSSHHTNSSHLSSHEAHVHLTPSQLKPIDVPALNDHYSSSSDLDDETDEETESDEEQATTLGHPAPPDPTVKHHNWRVVWLSVFTHLTTETLLICAQVCREWWVISKHPSLWQTVRLSSRKISSKFLQTISVWCHEMQHLSLEHLRPRSRAQGESHQKYAKTTRGCLESGLEHMLSAAGDKLLTLKIVDCSNILTDRSLFLVSCYCRNLYSLTYVSQTDPIGHEVIWALGAGCRNLASLKVPPRQPCQQHHRLSNRCLQMIGRCWPLLLAVSVGGPSIDIHGLVSIANSCPRLQVLEMDHMQEMTETVAKAMCQVGLRGLHTMILRNTPISPAAVMQFNGACCQLKALTIYLTPSICQGDNKDFHNIVSRFRALAKRRVLSEVLHVHAKYN